MKRMERKQMIEERISYVRGLEQELDKIHNAQMDLGYIVLDKPIRDGYYRTLKLRDDIARNKRAKYFEEILEAVKKEIWGREKKYADRNWKNYFKNSTYSYSSPGIKRLTQKEFNSLSSFAKNYFISITQKTFNKYITYYSCIVPRYYFESTYRKAYITKIRITSPDLESKEKEIMNILAHPNLRKYSIYYCDKYKYFDLSDRSCRLYYNRKYPISFVDVEIEEYLSKKG